MINESPHIVRIWDRNNSWGWDTISFQLTTPAGERFEARAGPIAFTIDGPAFVEIPARGEWPFECVIEFPDWTSDRDLAPLAGVPLEVRATLRIPPTPEAAKFHVFVGERQSPAVPSHPPHGWLKW